MSEISGDGILLGTSGDSPYYVEPQWFGPAPVIYCGGLGHQIEFEMALAREVDVPLYCFDPTNESARYLRRKRPSGLVFSQIGLHDHDGTVSFAVKKARAQFYNSVEIKIDSSQAVDEETFEVRRIPTIMKKLGHDRIDLLKIDIEGAEYAVLDDLFAQGIWPGQIALEWHYTYAGNGDRSRGIEITKTYIDRLKAQGYQIKFVKRDDTEMTLVRTTAA